MTWPAARSTLITLLQGVGYPVHSIPPQVIEEDGPVVMLVPPGRDVERHPSSIRRTLYRQRIRVLSHLSSEGDVDMTEKATEIDDAVEAINDALDGALQLSGEAESVTPPSWEELTVIEWPAGTGLVFAAMDCTVDIEIEKVVAFRP